MKAIYLIKSFIAMLVLMLSMNTAFGQEKDIVFMFEKKDGKNIIQTNELKQKWAVFSIKGLATQQDADNFLAETKKKDGIISFEISETMNTEGARSGKIVLEEWTDADFNKKVLLELGVKKIKIDGKEVETENMNQLDTRKANTKATEQKK